MIYSKSFSTQYFWFLKMDKLLDIQLCVHIHIYFLLALLRCYMESPIFVCHDIARSNNTTRWNILGPNPLEDWVLVLSILWYGWILATINWMKWFWGYFSGSSFIAWPSQFQWPNPKQCGYINPMNLLWKVYSLGHNDVYIYICISEVGHPWVR